MSDDQGFIEQQIAQRFEARRDTLTPPLPDKIAIEINNSCNHKCFFCPNPTMDRQRSVMDDALVYRVLADAYANGIREASFYSTGEPFLNRHLPEYVRYAKKLGFSYIYLSSNGGKVVSRRYAEVLEAGLDSLKFSVNAGDRATYAITHGVDEFEDVVANIEFVSRWRREHRPSLKLFVSFVETEISKPSFAALQQRVGPLVDEVTRYPFIVVGTPLKRRVEKDGAERPFVDYDNVDQALPLNVSRLTLPCYQLWSYLNVTLEGYLTACCSDFNNDLVVGNLNRTNLIGAWHSPEFQALRRAHIDKKIKNTLCHSCIAQKNLPYEKLNPHLMTNDHADDAALSEAT